MWLEASPTMLPGHRAVIQSIREAHSSVMSLTMTLTLTRYASFGGKWFPRRGASSGVAGRQRSHSEETEMKTMILAAVIGLLAGTAALAHGGGCRKDSPQGRRCHADSKPSSGGNFASMQRLKRASSRADSGIFAQTRTRRARCMESQVTRRTKNGTTTISWNDTLKTSY